MSESFEGVVVKAGPKGQHMTSQMDVTIRIFEADYDRFLSKKYVWLNMTVNPTKARNSAGEGGAA